MSEAGPAIRFRREDGTPVDLAGVMAGTPPPDLVLVWSDPHELLARTLAGGGDGHAALSGWVRDIRLHLVAARGAGACAFRPADDRAPPPDPLWLAAAALMLATDAEAGALLSELEGAAPRPRPDPLALILDRAPRGTPDLAAALALAQEQMVQLQETLEVYYRDGETLRAELARLRRSPLRRLAAPLRRLAGRR